jgi:hypothetical protein
MAGAAESVNAITNIQCTIRKKDFRRPLIEDSSILLLAFFGALCAAPRQPPLTCIIRPFCGESFLHSMEKDAE